MKLPVLLNNEDISFPDPRHSDEQGLLAIGGDLSPQRLLKAYSLGIFPWFETSSPILWWSPDPRLILLPKRFRVSRSLKKTLKKQFIFQIDTSFEQVIHACATSNDREENTWITQDMINAYIDLHNLGYAHSFEVWLDNKLVGGLYGISLGKAFFGESMFHHVRDASKAALCFLCSVMADWHFDFIDCQLPTEHLQQLGAEKLSRKQFLNMLENTLKHPTKQGKWLYP